MSTPFDQLGLGADLLGLAKCMPSSPGLATNLMGSLPMSTADQTMPAAANPSASANPRVTDDNIDRLGRVLAAECGPAVCSPAERQAVGSTFINRMNKLGTDDATDVPIKGQYAISGKADSDSLAMARELLSGQLPDNTGGAVNFYSPRSMPFENQDPKGHDVGGGLEYVPYPTRNTTLKNYMPSWVNGSDLTQRVIPGVRDWYLKVYGPS